MNETLVTVYGALVCAFAVSIGSLIDRWGGVILCSYIIANDL